MSRAASLLSVVATAAATALAGCGDGPICQAEVLVIIQSPAGAILEDSNVDLAGVQTDVRVRTTLGADEDVVLEVFDADGAVIGTVTAQTDDDGDVTFADVTLGPDAVRLRAFADGGECGADDDEVAIDLAAGRDCALTLRQAPLANDFYAPLGVLNLSNDRDPVAPDFQADLDIATQPGHVVELFVIGGDDGSETSAGTVTAGDEGDATFSLSLAQGRQSLRAVCSAPSGAVSVPSITTTVFVDTVAPGCALTTPAPGTTITPALDGNGDLADGVQLALAAAVTGGDTAGEPAGFVVTVDGSPTTIDGADVDDGGTTTAMATIAPAATPATAMVAVAGMDHAENTCTATQAYDVVYDGCAIAVVAPTTTVTEDADGDPANGVQVDVDLEVDVACAGATITSDCGLDDPSATVAGDGSATARATVCATATCDVQTACVFSVASPAGIATSVGATLDFDNLAPPVGIQLVQPSLACGAQVTPAADIDVAAPGVQIQARVVSAIAAGRQLEQTTSGGTQLFDASAAGGDVIVTLADGLNAFVGIASDDVGNTARSITCPVTLQDIVVSFLPPAADGAVGAADGTVNGLDLTFDLCGRTSTAGAAVEISVDGGPSLPATVNGTDWCLQLTLEASPPAHAIVATATAGMAMGSATLALSVDLTPPDPVGDLAVVADTRQSLRATWLAPGDGPTRVAAYVVKVAAVELTAGNFDTTGDEVIAGAPGNPGVLETLAIEQRRAGIGYWVGVAAIDGAGNRAAPVIVGPVTPAFDRTGELLPPNTAGQANSGISIARGKFNDDDYWDVAVAAYAADVGGVIGAGEVNVYFGSATGISDTPDVVIEGQQEIAVMGQSITAVRWSSATRHDLVIGEPFGTNGDGRVYVFHGGAGFTPGTYASTDADLQIGVNPIPNAFTGGALGWAVAALDFDGDARDDLAISAALGDDDNGAVVILYGGTVAGPVVLLSDTDTSQLGGAVVHLLRDPNGASGDLFGNYLFDVGPTMGTTDATDDLLVSYVDGVNQAYVYRGRTSRPTTPGVHARAFTVGTDVRIDYATGDTTTELASSAGSISDLNNDGARDLVISAYREGSNLGRVMIIDGNTVGTGGVASTAVAGVVVTTINPTAGATFLGAAIVNNAAAPGADVDGDGFEDLLVTSRTGGVARLHVWFGGSIPTGTATTASAQHVITGPSTFTGTVPGVGGTPHIAIWAGDVNGDGLQDICWADNQGNAIDGSFEVLWDDGN